MRHTKLLHGVLYATLLIVGLIIGAIVAAYAFWPVMVAAAMIPVPDGGPREFVGAAAYFLWMLIPFVIAHVFALTLFRAMLSTPHAD